MFIGIGDLHFYSLSLFYFFGFWLFYERGKGTIVTTILWDKTFSKATKSKTWGSKLNVSSTQLD